MNWQDARAAGRILLCGGVSGAFYSAHAVERRLHPVSDERRDRYLHRWAGLLLPVLGVELLLDAPAPPPLLHEGPRLVVSNHRSMLDILLMARLFQGHILARGDMAAWPVLGEFARAAGTLFVDRADGSSRAVAIRRIRERLLAGRTVVVFPEGTTFEGDEVRPFHGGAFLAAQRSRSQVQPVGIAYQSGDAIFGDESFGAHLRRLTAAGRIAVAVCVGEPLSADSRRAEALRDRTRAAVQALVQRARARFTI